MIKIIDKATREVVTTFSDDKYEMLIESESCTEHNTMSKICKNCRYAVELYDEQHVQCYNKFSPFFTNLLSNSCVLWEENNFI